MMKFAIAAAMVCSAGLAIADDKPMTANDATASSKATAEKGAGDSMLAKEFWDKNAKGGYLSREDVARFKGADGKTPDMRQIDTDNDGRVSEREWMTYQKSAGAAGLGAAGVQSEQPKK